MWFIEPRTNIWSLMELYPVLSVNGGTSVITYLSWEELSYVSHCIFSRGLSPLTVQMPSDCITIK